MKKILCPIKESLIDGPGHQMYGINCFEKVSNGEIIPIVYPFKQSTYSKWEILGLNLQIAWKALTTQHDAFYYGIDPQNLVLLGVFKRLGMYRKPMFAWKYTVIKHTNSNLKDTILKLYYNAFNKIFMITENHIPETYAEGIVKNGKLEYMTWGEDLDYINKLKVEKNPVFTFISTGKAHRDYETTLRAFAKVKNARLKLYVSPSWGGQTVDIEKLEKESSGNVELYIVKQHLTYRDIYIDILHSHCALCICKPVDFGVGYTQVLDSLACGIPCILTWNKDNPIDLDKEGVGITVPPLDINSLSNAMQKMVEESDAIAEMSKKGRKLIEEKYNIEHTTQKVLEIITSELNKK